MIADIHVHDCPECGAYVPCSVQFNKDRCPSENNVCEHCLIRLNSVDPFNGDTDAQEAGW